MGEAILRQGSVIIRHHFYTHWTDLVFVQATELSPPDPEIVTKYNYTYDLSAYRGTQSPLKVSYQEFQYIDMCKYASRPSIQCHWVSRPSPRQLQRRLRRARRTLRGGTRSWQCCGPVLDACIDERKG